MIAHELAHIRNHDTLTMTITATIAGAISMLAQFGMFFGGGNRDNNNGGLGMIGTLAMVILAPIAAMLVQMAISRTREYAADDSARRIAGHPEWLASALRKLDAAAHAIPNEDAERNPATAHHVHRQSADRAAAWTTCSRPIPRPRTASPRSAAGARDGPAASFGGARAPRARHRRPVRGTAVAAAARGAERGGRPPAFRRCHALRKRGMTGVHARPQTIVAASLAAAVARPRRAPHRRRHRRRRAAAASGRSTSSSSRAISARCPSATARWCGPSSRRCCAGSARCAICSRTCSKSGLPPSAPQVEDILLIGAAQILFLDVPDHAVGRSVGAAGAGRPSRLALFRPGQRRAAASSRATARPASPRSTRVLLDTPEWLMQRWIAHYGEATARAIAAAHAQEPALDLTVKSDPRAWADKLDGRVLADRHGAHDRVGSDPAACRASTRAHGGCRTPPPRCRRGCSATCAGKSVADLCAAPGGKTAQLAHAGAQVTAVDRSAPRLERGCGRISRGCSSTPRSSRPTPRQWQGGPFDAVLVDAPCSSTGTIRRHPDIPWLKSEADLAKLDGPANPPARPRRGAAQARRHAGLLHLLAGTRGGRGRDRGAARPQSGAAPQPDRGRRGRGPWPSC